jgi:hypothetical protein
MIRTLTFAVLMLGFAMLTPPAAFAQDEPDPNPGALTLTAAVDVVNTYMFRGIRQNFTGVAVQPFADVGINFFTSDEGNGRHVTLNVGTWNSLHSGDTGAEAPFGNMWYESDFYTTLSAGVGGGVTFAGTFTAYTSPNTAFSTVREIAVRTSVDDSGILGAAAVRPYALFAFEILAEPGGVGQADGGENAGTYLELGAAPGFAATRGSLTFPLKLGLSLGDYYELRGADETVLGDRAFGFFSVGAQASVGLGGTSRFGAFNLHGGVEFQRLGDTPTAFNDGDKNKIIGSIGIGLNY